MTGYTPGQVLGGKTVTLGSLVLGAVDAAGVAWTIGKDGLQGWDSPDVRTQYTPRQSDHGAWAGPSYLDARVITLAGTITAPDLPTLDTAMDQLSAAASLNDTVLIVTETIPRQCTVRRSGRLLMQPVTDCVATYSVLLTAADPRRYSTVLQSQSAGLPSVSGGLALPLTMPLTVTATTTSGAFTLTNAGTANTRPVLTIAGPVTNPQILAQLPDGSVGQLTYSGSLASGDTLVIDCDAHTVILNGQASRRRYLSGAWPEIPAGGNAVFQWTSTTYDPSALLSGTCRAAWL